MRINYVSICIIGMIVFVFVFLYWLTFSLTEKYGYEKSPNPGETWIMHNENPFNTKINKVKIIEIKKGWVKFRYLDSGYEDSDPVSLFLVLFEREPIERDVKIGRVKP